MKDASHQDVAKLLAEAKSPLFVTGAGLSADSGLPTYRGVGGLYDVEVTEEGLPIEEVLSGHMLHSDPGLTWKYLREIGEACRGAEPNRGHRVIAEVERAKPGTWVLTQNVDGLHHEAGTRNLIEAHGRASGLSCMACDFTTTADAFFPEGREPELPPQCPRCGEVLRPDVVLFGEMLHDRTLEGLQNLMWGGIDLVFNVGTSALFPYIMEPARLANSVGIPVVEINPGETGVSDLADFRFRSGAAETLDRIWNLCQS